MLPGSSESMTKEEKALLNLQMGVRYLDMGMLEVAKQKLDTALKLDSRNADIHNALADFYERIHEVESADDHYETAVDLSPDNFSIRNNYGRFLCDRGKFAEGIGLLQQSLDLPLNNRKWFALTNMGICYLKQNNAQLAESYFRQALQVDSTYSAALLEMMKISYQNGNYMSARAFLERYLGPARHTAETLWYAMQTERALGNEVMSLQYLDQLLLSFPASKEAQQAKTAVNR